MGFRDDAPPWSFFIPVTLAVAVGVLAADAIRLAIGTVLGRDETPRQVVSPTPPAADAQDQAGSEAAAPTTAAADEPRGSGRGDRGQAPAPGSPAAQIGSEDAAASSAARTRLPEGPAADESPEPGGVLELPDSMTARRDGDPAACVNGTVVHRVQGGWEQALENDAPIACVIVHR